MQIILNSTPASETLTNLFTLSPAGSGSDERLGSRSAWAATQAAPGGLLGLTPADDTYSLSTGPVDWRRCLQSGGGCPAVRQRCGSGRDAADAADAGMQGCSIPGPGRGFPGQTWGQLRQGKAEGRGRTGSKRISSVN